MRAANCFFDSNVLLYLLSADETKANRSEALIGKGGRISVQVLNECAANAATTGQSLPLINIGSGSDLTIAELAQTVMQVIGFSGQRRGRYRTV